MIKDNSSAVDFYLNEVRVFKYVIRDVVGFIHDVFCHILYYSIESIFKEINDRKQVVH